MAGNMMTRIMRAEQSSDLSEARAEDETADVDVVRAAGLAGVRRRLGSYLARALASAGRDCRVEILEVLRTGGARKFPGLSETQLKVCAVGALYRYVNPTCPVCEGRKFRVIPGTPALSDIECHECQGTGRLEMETPPWSREALGWMEHELAQAESTFSSAVGRKLGRG